MARPRNPDPVVDLDVAARLHDDPEFFCRQLLRVELEPWQVQFMHNCVDHPRVAVKSSPGVGKSCAIALLILWNLLTRFPCKIIATAPSASQLETVLVPELQKWHSRLPAVFADQLAILNGRAFLKAAPAESFFETRTASRDRPESLQGIHAAEGTLLFIVEEASGVDDQLTRVIMASQTSPNAHVVLVSNPTRLSGFFFDCFTKNRELWKLQTVAGKDSRFSRDSFEIARLTQEGKQGSNEWLIQVEGEFPTTEDDLVCPPDLVRDAIGRDITPDGPIVWGVDVARHGADRSALAKRQGAVLLEPIHWWHGKDLMQTAYLINDEYESAAVKPVEIFIDSIGMGAGVVDRLREMNLPVRGVNVAESAPLKDRYYRLRDDLWWRGRLWFESLAVRIPPDEDFINEITAVRFKYDVLNKIKVESKDDLRGRGYRSPDLADAFLISLMSTASADRAQSWSGEIEVATDWVV